MTRFIQIRTCSSSAVYKHSSGELQSFQSSLLYHADNTVFTEPQQQHSFRHAFSLPNDIKMKFLATALFATVATAFAGLYDPNFANPADSHHALGNDSLAVRSAKIDCGDIPSFLTADDCNYLSSIGVAGVGKGDDQIKVGSDGDLFFVLNNASPGQDLIVLVWYGDKQWINANAPVLTISLPAGSSMDISLADNGLSGGFGGKAESLCIYSSHRVLLT